MSNGTIKKGANLNFSLENFFEKNFYNNKPEIPVGKSNF